MREFQQSAKIKLSSESERTLGFLVHLIKEKKNLYSKSRHLLDGN
jgi:hypothetical protein